MKYAGIWIVLCLSYLFFSGLPLFADHADDLQKHREERKQAAQKKRRLIFNNDGNDNPRGEITPEKFYSQRTSWIINSKIDSIFYCDGVFNHYTHQSNVSELLCSPILRHEFSKHLIEQGTDPLRLIVEFGKKYDKEVFWSMRMNDIHDAMHNGDRKNDALMTQWKKQNPDFLMGKPGDIFLTGEYYYWSAVNYSLPEVRQKVYDIVRDVITRYDVDGIELDFLRYPILFRESLDGQAATAEQLNIINQFMRNIRTLLEEVGLQKKKPILLAVRVFDSLTVSKILGCDYEQWMKEGLIDLLIPGDFVQFEPWKNVIGLAHKYGVQVYPCIGDHRMVSKLTDGIGAWYSQANHIWQSGADGIYLFNIQDYPYTVCFNAARKENLRAINRLADPQWLKENAPEFQSIPGALWSGIPMKNAIRYAHIITFSPKNAVIQDQQKIELHSQFPEGKIHYTLDGSPVTSRSAIYSMPFPLRKTTLVRAAVIRKDGSISPEFAKKYRIFSDRFITTESLPFRCRGMEIGTGRATIVSVDRLSAQPTTALFLDIKDADAVSEIEIFVNGTGPYFLPPSSVPGEIPMPVVIQIPTENIRQGENTVGFIFADDVNQSTSGFDVHEVKFLDKGTVNE